MSEMKKEVRYAEDKPKKPASPCDGCPYGRNNPCIGFCMKKLLGQKS